MMRVLSAPEYGLLFLQDDETGEVSIQCLCGGMASWWRRVVLTRDEVDEFRCGSFDAKRMMVEICRNLPSVSNRMVPPIELSELPAP